MNLVTVENFKDWYKANESAFAAENQIIEEKLSLGINGLEWLVLQVNTDDTRKESLNATIEFCEQCYKKNFESLIKDAFTMDHETFYEKHAINWWIIIDDGLTYLKTLKDREYNRYSDIVNWIYAK